MKYFLLILTIITLLACKDDSVFNASEPIKILNLNDTSEVCVGQLVGLSNNEIVFRFDSLIQDSRCPIGVVCVWQGNASIHITFPLHVDTLDTYFKPMISYANYKIYLIDLLPCPNYQQPILKNNYIAKLKITL
jgi:hypothetical protein